MTALIAIISIILSIRLSVTVGSELACVQA